MVKRLRSNKNKRHPISGSIVEKVGSKQEDNSLQDVGERALLGDQY